MTDPIKEAGEQEREAFEKWAAAAGYEVHRDNSDKYRDYHRATTRFAWEAWQARSLLSPSPAPGMKEWLDIAISLIGAYGVEKFGEGFDAASDPAQKTMRRADLDRVIAHLRTVPAAPTAQAVTDNFIDPAPASIDVRGEAFEQWRKDWGVGHSYQPAPGDAFDAGFKAGWAKHKAHVAAQPPSSIAELMEPPPMPEPFMELHRELTPVMYEAWADQLRARDAIWQERLCTLAQSIQPKEQ